LEAAVAGEVLLVGSIPLETAEQVFRRVGAPPGEPPPGIIDIIVADHLPAVELLHEAQS
jgi:hypothetical protein